MPRLATASGESRIADSPLVRQVGDRLESLHRELLAAVRRYTEEHPLVKNLRSDIRQTELDLTRARIQALGSDIDREELTLRTDNELIAIEIRVLEPEVKELRDRLTVLGPVLDEVKFHDRLAQDSRSRISTIETLREQLSATPESGYVRRLEDIASPAETVRIEMRLRKSWGLALLASVIFGIGFAFVREFIDTTLRTDYDVRRHLDYPVLAVAPRVGSNEVLTLRASRSSIMAEIYDTLATVLLSAPSEHASRIFMVTSTNPQEGKTVTSINLAVALARQGKRTLLVDGDMRVPSIHTSLTLPSSPGLSEVLAGSVALNGEGVLQDSEVPNLRVLACGVQPESPYELLDPSRTGPIAAQMRHRGVRHAAHPPDRRRAQDLDGRGPVALRRRGGPHRAAPGLLGEAAPHERRRARLGRGAEPGGHRHRGVLLLLRHGRRPIPQGSPGALRKHSDPKAPRRNRFEPLGLSNFEHRRDVPRRRPHPDRPPHVRFQLLREPERRQHGHDDELPFADREDRPRENLSVAVFQDPGRQVGMEAGHPGDHLLVDGPVDAAAEGLPPATAAGGLPGRLGGVRDDLPEGGEGVDGASVAREGDELEQGLIKARGRRARPQSDADLAAQQTLAPPRGGRRDAGEAQELGRDGHPGLRASGAD